MIESALKLKDLCQEAVHHGNSELLLPEDSWIALEEIRQTLEPIFVATKQLQAKNLTLPDVHKIVTVCWMKTAAIGN